VRALLKPVLLSAALLAASVPAQASAARVTHVDCSRAAPGNGSLAHPLNTLARASAVSLRPGSRLLLRRGSGCTGTLAPSGDGAPGRPALIGAYGHGPRPRIAATGEDAVLLKDSSHVVLRGLDVSNRGSAEARRRGVHVVATAGVVRDVTVRGMRIHDVQGDLAKDAGGSGGIQVDVLGPAPTHFDNLLIERNLIEDVSRSGIFIVGTADSARPRAVQPWPAASTRVRVRANRLRRLGGDGIVPLGTVGAVVERNVVSRGNLRGRGLADPAGMICNAGIWTFHANGTVIQRNEVFGMRFNGCDGTGFDVDYDQDGTVIQFNYSHDNEGGFVLLCTDADPRAADVRFNLSVDDRFAANQSPCSLRAGATYSGLRFFNNTVVGAALSWGILGTPSTALLDPAGLELDNNLFVARPAQSAGLLCPARCTANLWSGLPPSGAGALTADPLLRDPARRGRGRLRVGLGFRPRPASPAARSGTVVAGSPGVDYFGVPLTTPPPRGFARP
jgi:Right handed beta helix region